MARVAADGTIAGDPRWVVADREDGANVNGWHWEEKDITAAAKKLLTRTVQSVKLYDEGNTKLRLLSFLKDKGPDGEATALNRRKKVGVFFDFTFTIQWHGEIIDPHGYASADAEGTLHVESVDQDCIHDVNIDVELDSLRMAGTDRLLTMMRTEGIARLRGLLNHFYFQLRAKYDPRAAAEREEMRAARYEAERAVEAAEDEARLAEEAEVLAQCQAGKEPADTIRSSAARRADEEAELRRREENAARRKKELREAERAAADEAARLRKAAEEEERRRQKEADRLERAGRATNEGTTKTDDELLDFITGD